MFRIAVFLILASLAGCADDNPMAPYDMGDMGDQGAADLVHDLSDAPDTPEDLDEGFDLSDAGEADLADQAEISRFGEISGTCGELDSAELNVSMPFFFQNQIFFESEFEEPADLTRLSEGGQEIIADGNAGGSSIYSEVFSFEVLQRCEMAVLLKTENEVIYDNAGKITDLLVQFDTLKIGVSVTRAVTFPRETTYTIEAAQALLEDKLSDILESSANVSIDDQWRKQILHVIADTTDHALSLQSAWMLIAPSIAADTIVYVTVSNGTDDFIY